MKRGLIGAGAAVALTAAGGAWFVGGDRSTTHDVPPADAAAPPSVLERGPGEPVAGAAAEVPTPPAASADADRDSSASPDAGEVAAAAGGPETEREGANPDAGKAVAAPAERAAPTPTRPVRTERPAAVAPAKAPAQRAPAREVAHAQLVIATRMPNRTWVRIDGKEPVRLGPSPSSFDVPAGRRSVRVEREGSAACTLAVHLDPDAKRTLLVEADGVSELVGTTRTPVACK